MLCKIMNKVTSDLLRCRSTFRSVYNTISIVSRPMTDSIWKQNQVTPVLYTSQYFQPPHNRLCLRCCRNGNIETKRLQSTVQGNHGNPVPPTQTVESNLTEPEFEKICEETLDSLTELFEDLQEEDFTTEQFDVCFASGVITVKLGVDSGTIVINKQSPNKQIWLSSPFSGPKRYDFVDGCWVYKHNGIPLHDLLTSELSALYNADIDFTHCAHGRRS